MNFIENVKSKIEEYKLYKNSRYSKAVTSHNSKNRNIFKFIQLKSFGKKYRDVLYKHFRVMNDIDSYEFLIDLFGKKRLERALDNPENTTTQIADMLLKSEGAEFFDGSKKNHVLDNMRNCIIFNRATELNLTEFQLGIQPGNFRRESLNGKSMIDIFEENGISKDVLKEIYKIYGMEIISQYNSDSYLRNATVLKLDGKYEKSSAVGGLQDHITYYSEEDFNAILQKYFGEEELSKTEQYILIGLLAKESDLIGTYTVKQLREHPDYIKSEIAAGVFKDIVVSGKTYTNEERKRITALSNVWSADDLNRYNNLALLKQRLSSLPKTQDRVDTIHKIEEILSKSLTEITMQSGEIADFMDSAFMDYEVENRNQIIENVYNPEKAKEIVITDLQQMGSAAMLHFFAPERVMSNFESYVKDLEEKRSKELGKAFKFSEEEKKTMLLQYQAKENHYITDYALDFEGIGQVGSFDTRYVTNTSNQLSAMVTTPEEILKGNGIRGQIALGFSKQTISPELIATISNRNIHSNKGIDYVETDNQFRDFSASYDELTSEKQKYGDNTEVVLFRNSYESSLKPSYVMYIANGKLDSETEKRKIKSIKKQMEQVGLEVPLVIFDRFSIKEKIKTNELEELEQ